MKTNKKYAGRLFLVILILLALSLTGCAKKPPVVIKGGSQIVELKAGQTATADGFLLTPEALVELMECCSNKVD